MSDKIVGFAGLPVPVPEGEPDPRLIEMLERVLAEAKRGEIAAMCATIVRPHHHIYSLYDVRFSVPAPTWFEGTACGSFDGEVRAVDLRGALPEIKLILSAGGKEIDCVCRNIDIETIRTALNRRVRISGLAIYDGKSGLPRRIEASELEIVQGAPDFARWKGAFEPFEIEPWEEDD